MNKRFYPPEQTASKKGPSWLDGLRDFLGIKLTGENVDHVNVHDTVEAFAKTPLGGVAMAKGSSDVTIQYNTEAQNLLAGVNEEIADAKQEIEAEKRDARSEGFMESLTH